MGVPGLLVLVLDPASYYGALTSMVLGAGLWVFGRYVSYLEFRAEPLPPPVVEALDRAATAPVGALYLRSFKQEAQSFVIGPKEKYGAYASRWMTGLPDTYGDVYLTFEQFFYTTLTEAFGSFVALGGPEDYITPEGALRVYARDTDWQERLNDLAGRTACIVVEVGESQNLRWEFEHLLRHGLQKKLFVVTQPSHDGARFAWAYRGVIWRLKGIHSVPWREFVNDLGAIGYELNLEDPGPGSVIGFDENNRGVLLTTQAELPFEFVEPMRAWVVYKEIVGRHIPTQCLSCGGSFRAAMGEDGKVRDRFCRACAEGLSPTEQFLRRYRLLFFALTALTMAFLAGTPAGSWALDNHEGAFYVALLVGYAIYVWVSNLYQRRIRKRAAVKYRQLAECGDAIAMCHLALFYRGGGKGLPKNDAQAVCWLLRAADAGDSMAMYHLGLYYHKGDAGLSQDGAQALNWYKKAANAGSTSAMNNIAYLYDHGECGLAIDKSEARNWYQKAANLGNMLARDNLETSQQSSG